MKFTDRLNALIHPLMVKYVCNSYDKKVIADRRANPSLFVPVETAVLRRHRELWGRFGIPISDQWLRMLSGCSGFADYRFVPETVFYSVVERCLNNCDAAGYNVEDKSTCLFYIPYEWRPQTVLRYVRGVFFDGEMNAIPEKQAYELLHTWGKPLVGKPSMHSCGGSDVVRYHSAEDVSIEKIKRNFEGYVLQPVIEQEDKVSTFNPASLNTCRLMTFRRPWNGETTVIAGMLRMGCGGDVADNLARGGISVDIDNNGILGEFAYDHDFRRFTSHPRSGLSFKGRCIPYYSEMSSAVCNVASHVPDYNLLSFDVVARPDGTPCIIEINACAQTLTQLQTCRPLFGEETESVVDWCEKNRPKLDRFNHFRTWY